MAREIISESRLREIISEEAARFKKKLTLEAEKKQLLKKLHEMYMEEEAMGEDIDENIFKKGAQAVAGAAKAVFAPSKVAREATLKWLSSQDQDLVQKAKAQDKAAFDELVRLFPKFLKAEGIGGDYAGNYWTPFYAEFGELGKKYQAQRDKGFISKGPLQTGSNAEE